jgi:hypothetical protein
MRHDEPARSRLTRRGAIIGHKWATLEAWLARARSAAEAFVRKRGQTVAGLVDQVGGPEAFVGMVRATLLLNSAWWSRDAEYGKLRQLESELTAANQELELLGGSATYYPAGSLGEAAINRGVALGQAIQG